MYGRFWVIAEAIESMVAADSLTLAPVPTVCPGKHHPLY